MRMLLLMLEIVLRPKVPARRKMTILDHIEIEVNKDRIGNPPEFGLAT